MEDHAPYQGQTPTRVPITCPGCGYNLTGAIIGGTCPECGSTIASIRQGGKGSGKAVAALVLGICSIVGCMFYGVPGIVCGVLAVVFARQVRNHPDADQLSDTSRSMNNAGRICGIVGLSLSALTVLLMVAYFVFIFVWLVPQTQQNHAPYMTPPAPTQPAPQTIPAPAPTNP